jgi:alpha-N-acetylglucosaminidase
MRKSHSLFSILASLVLVTRGQAALIVYTGFDAPTNAIGSNLAAWGAAGNSADPSGVGWTNGFQYSSSYGSGILLNPGNLAFGAQTGVGFSANSTATDGGSYYRDFNTNAHQAWLNAASTNGEVWVSFLVRANTATSVPNTSGALGLVLRADSGFNNLVVGAAAYNALTWGYSDGVVYGSGQYSGVTRNTSVIKLTLRFDYTSSGTTVTGFIDTTANPGTLPASFVTNNLSTKPTFNGILLTSSTANSFQWDEIAVGTTYADVAMATATNLPPILITQPIGGTDVVGGSFTFSVGASGSGPLAYQWSHGGNTLTGATNSVLMLTNLSLADSGSYSVTVSNAFGVTNSTAALLKVATIPVIGTNLSAVAGLLQRLLPLYTNRFALELIPADGGQDAFEIESRADQIVLGGNNGVSVASALNYYLKNYCHCDVSWNGDQLALPYPLPPVSPKVHVASPHKYRFAYNPCTHGYTMSWWRWPDWEREIDYLALNGINVAQVTPGTEAVFQNVLTNQFGYSASNVLGWLCLPSHLPWMLLDNMQSFGGPVPQSLVNGRLVLGQQICQRMRDLGIEPMLQGYYGMVPPDFKTRFPAANVLGQGTWSAGLQRPDMLSPTDPLFPQFATNWYRLQTNLFGPVRFFAADPFHEGGNSSGVNLPLAGQAIQDAMASASPVSTWVIMSWGSNPNQTMLDALNKDLVLVLDLNCEDNENWRSRNNFNGTPWLWCAIQNYGGNSGLLAKLGVLAQRPVTALTDPARGRYSGIGFVPEGSETIPAAYEMLLENAWRTNAPVLDQWIRDYARRRYGKSLPGLEQAWAILQETVYGNVQNIQAPHNSIIEARPSLSSGILARTWSTTTIPYDPTRLAQAWNLLLSCASDPGLNASDTYRFDVADVTRQVLADLATRCQRTLGAAYTASNQANIHLYGDQILSLIADLDTLTATRREWLLGKWLANARSWGTTTAESNLCEYNARMLPTTWTSGVNELNDYANREWAGLLSGFYLPRWQQFITNLYAAVDNNQSFNESSARTAIGNWELQWINQHQVYPSTPAGDTLVISSNLFQKYYPAAASSFDRTPYTVSNTWSSAICSTTPVVWNRDVSSLLSGPGDYVVTFQYTSGSSALGIYSASFVQNGTNVSTDSHFGWTGTATYDNSFYLSLTSTAPTVVLSMVTASQGGTSSAGNIIFQKCGARTINGSWHPADCSTADAVWTWDVTSVVTNSGDYQVVFQYQSGANNLAIDWVSIGLTNQVWDKDLHSGICGVVSSNNTYSLRVYSVPAGQPVVVRVGASSVGGTNSNGYLSPQRNAPFQLNPTTYSDWSAAYGLQGANPGSDPYSLGWPLALDYFTGANPTNGAGMILPNLTMVPAITNSATNFYAVFSFTCQSGLAGVNSWIETSADLAAWSPASSVLAYAGQVTQPDGRLRVSYSSVLPVNAVNRQYFRLRVGW